MNVGSIQSYVGREHRGDAGLRGRQQLVIGPGPARRLRRQEHEQSRPDDVPRNARFDAESIRRDGSTITCAVSTTACSRSRGLRATT